jgi:hypothetical protein
MWHYCTHANPVSLTVVCLLVLMRTKALSAQFHLSTAPGRRPAAAVILFARRPDPRFSAVKEVLLADNFLQKQQKQQGRGETDRRAVAQPATSSIMLASNA